MSTAQSSFIGGMKKDFSPLISSNDTLTDALNATIITFNGNEFMLQQDMGNGRIETAYLPKGYVPVGIAEHGGIIYVASYNPLTQRSQIGSFPSPERNISSNENGGSTLEFDINEFKKPATAESGGNIIASTMTITKPFTMKDIIRPGDGYYVSSDSSSSSIIYNNDNSGLINFILGVQNNSGQIITVRQSSDESSNDDWIRPKITPDREDYDIFNSKIAGNLAITAELPCIDGINITTSTKFNDDKTRQYSLSVSIQYSEIRDVQWLWGILVKITKVSNGVSDTSYTTYNFTGNGFSESSSKLTSVNTTKLNITSINNEGYLLFEQNIGEDEVHNIEVTPIMANGVVNYLMQPISIDGSKIGSGDLTVTKWQFMSDIENNISRIRLSLEHYPKPNTVLDSINLKFYSYTDFKNSDQTTKTNPIYTYNLQSSNGFNGSFIIVLEGYYVPVKDLYIVEISGAEYINSEQEGVVTSTLENRDIDVKALLATEMYNELYVTQNTDLLEGQPEDALNDFSLLVEKKLTNNLRILESDTPISIINNRSTWRNPNVVTVDSDSPIDTTENYYTHNTNEIIVNYRFSGQAIIDNKDWYVFDNIDTSKLKFNFSNIRVTSSLYTPGQSNQTVDLLGATKTIDTSLNTLTIKCKYTENMPFNYTELELSNIAFFSNNQSLFKDSYQPFTLMCNYWDGDNNTGGFIGIETLAESETPSTHKFGQGYYNLSDNTYTDYYSRTNVDNKECWLVGKNINSNAEDLIDKTRSMNITKVIDTLIKSGAANGNVGLIAFGGSYPTGASGDMQVGYINKFVTNGKESKAGYIAYIINTSGDIVFLNCCINKNVYYSSILSNLNKRFYVRSSSGLSGKLIYGSTGLSPVNYDLIFYYDLSIDNSGISTDYYSRNGIIYDNNTIRKWINLYTNNENELKILIQPDYPYKGVIKNNTITVIQTDFDSMEDYYNNYAQGQIIIDGISNSKLAFDMNQVVLSSSTFFYRSTDGKVYCNQLESPTSFPILKNIQYDYENSSFQFNILGSIKSVDSEPLLYTYGSIKCVKKANQTKSSWQGYNEGTYFMPRNFTTILNDGDKFFEFTGSNDIISY